MATPTKNEEVTLTLGGMHCAACVARVERALTAAPGVELALVNLATRRAKVRYNPKLTNLAAMKWSRPPGVSPRPPLPKWRCGSFATASWWLWP
jgi:copper chaperone CopZ